MLKRDVPFFEPEDSGRLFRTKIRTEDSGTLLISQSERNDAPFEVQFTKGHKLDCFDLDTLGMEKSNPSPKTTGDRLLATYQSLINKRPLSYATKGLQIKEGAASEMMFVGPVEFVEKSNRFVMARPKMVIGTDRMELYDFLVKKKTVYNNANTRLLKLIFAVTAGHFLLVRVPTLFSRFFGDELSVVEQALGSEDQSESGLKLQRMKAQS